MDTFLSVDCGAQEQYDSDSSDSSLDIIIPNMTIVLTGNSSAVQFGHENILLGEKQVKAENAVVSSIVPVERNISEHHISVINMIDLHEAEHVDHLVDQLVNETEIHAFIFVVRLGQLTDDDKMALEWVQRVFGGKVLQFVLILFTYETEEECESIIDDLKSNPVLEQLVEKCGGRYHTCNKMMNNQSEMRELMNKIEHLINENLQQHREMYNTPLRQQDVMANRSGLTSETEPNVQFSFVLLGNKQAGKSATGNTILGRQAFISKKSSKSVTHDVAVESGDVDGFPVTVYDTPGLLNTDKREEIEQMINEKVLQKCESVLSAFLLVIRADRFTEEDIKTVEKIEELLGETRLEKTWILFTRGDELEEENMTIQEFIEDNEELKTLVQKYEHRYHLFNNKITGSTDQSRLLLVKMIQMLNGENDGVNAHTEPDAPVSSLLSRRIVLLGKTGFGKSSSGNTILGQKEFFAECSSKSITSKCSVKHSTVFGKSVSVVDTPGFFDTRMKLNWLMKEIARSVYFSSPGPHAFLIVLRASDRFTEQEQQIADLIKLMFGQEVLKYSIILFTHGDLLDGVSVEKLIEENSGLRSLVQQCGGRYHVFNNRDEENREQVEDLLQKTDSMIQQNGGGHYTNQMYEDAQRFRQEEEERKLREEEERKRQVEKQQQERENNEKVEHYRNYEVKRRRENPEFKQFYRKNLSFLYRIAFALGSMALYRTAFALASMAVCQSVGACIGGTLGSIAGPAGSAVGILVGTAVGRAAGIAFCKMRRNL